MNKIKEQIDRELSSVTFDSIDKERLERRLSQTTRKDKRMKLNKKIITGIAAAVAGVAVLTVSAGAATGWDYGRLVSGFFGREDIDQSEADAINKLDSLMQQIPEGSVTSTFTNYDASFDGIICDGKTMMVSVTLKSKDGTPFTPEEKNRASRYSGFFNFEGIERGSGSERFHVKDDGSLQCMCTFKVDITEKTKIKVSYNYLLCDSDVLKYCDVSEINPDEVLDPGVLTAEFEVDVNKDYKDFELKNADGKVMNAHITPISLELTYEPTTFADGRNYISTDPVIYDKDGNELVGSYEYSGAGGDPEGLETGIANITYTFAKVIDVDDIGGMTCMEYSFGNVPTE